MKYIQSKLLKNINLSIKPALVLILIFGVAKLQKLQSNNYQQDITGKVEYLKQEKLEKSSLSIQAKIPTFGFSNLAADWFHLQFLQYFGDSEARETIGYSLSPNYFEAVVEHDPRFVRAYFVLSPATSIFAGQPKKGVNLIEKGLKFISPTMHPDAYYLWIYKGVDEMLFLGDTKSAQKSYETAALWTKYSNRPNAINSAKNASQMSEFLKKNTSSVVSQIGAWTMILNSSSGELTQQKAIDRIEQLGGEVIVFPDGSVKIRVPEDAT